MPTLGICLLLSYLPFTHTIAHAVLYTENI